jgi:hypothetical protein
MQLCSHGRKKSGHDRERDREREREREREKQVTRHSALCRSEKVIVY